MISPVLLKFAAWRRWIFVAAILWSVALAFVARGTARFRNYQRHVFQSQLAVETDNLAADLNDLKKENSRLQSELQKIPDLSAAAAQLKKQIDAQQKEDMAVWAAKSNVLQSAIEEKQRELTEINQWSTEWHRAKQVEAAQARLDEKAKESSGDPEKEYAQAKEVLSNFALAQKRLMGIRKEWTQLDKSEKDQFRPRLEEAQAEWWAAHEKLGKDQALYQDFPVNSESLSSGQDPSTVLLMRSVIPDQNGVTVSVFLDGTVTFTK